MITEQAIRKRKKLLVERRMITSMTLPIEQVKWLDYMAAQNDMSRSRLIEQMIEQRRREAVSNTEGQKQEEMVAA